MTQTQESHDAEEVKKLIQAFFDSINAEHVKALAACFVPNANLNIVRQDPPRAPAESQFPQFAAMPMPTNAVVANSEVEEKITVVMRTSIEKFVELIREGKKGREGKPDLKIHEQADLDSTDVKVDGLFAEAWSPFRVTFDRVLHHYGTIVYTFCKIKEEDGEKEWRIDTLTQAYRRAPGWEHNSDFV